MRTHGTSTNGCPVNKPASPPARRRLRLIALAVAAVCVLALAAGAFVVSYPGVRATAVSAGVAADVARVYPGIFDAVLLVAGAAALSLRSVWRAFAWLVIVAVIGAMGAAVTVHALSVALPKRPMEATVAAVPWALLVVGLILLDAIARQGRPGRNAVPPGHAAAPGLAVTARGYGGGSQSSHGAATVPLSALLADNPVRLAADGPAVRLIAPAAASPAAQPAAQPTQPSVHPQQAEAGKPAGTGPEDQQQAETGRPAEADPPEPPGSPPRQQGGRDEPSDADAGPSEPSASCTRPPGSPGTPGKTPNGAKPEQPSATEPVTAQPAAGKPAASKEPAAQSPKAESAS